MLVWRQRVCFGGYLVKCSLMCHKSRPQVSSTNYTHYLDHFFFFLYNFICIILLFALFFIVLSLAAPLLPVTSLQPLSSFTTLQTLVEGVASNKQVLQDGRPDHVTYRMYLWKCMSQFSSLAESKSKIIVPLLYQFIEYVLHYSVDNSFVHNIYMTV